MTRYYVSQLAYLAARLDAMPEGEGTVLDNSCLLFTSSMWSGTQHDASKLPVVLAGGLGGTLPTGRVARLPGQGRRRPQALQHVPLDHGPDGREARPLRRRRERLAGF